MSLKPKKKILSEYSKKKLGEKSQMSTYTISIQHWAKAHKRYKN